MLTDIEQVQNDVEIFMVTTYGKPVDLICELTNIKIRGIEYGGKYYSKLGEKLPENWHVLPTPRNLLLLIATSVVFVGIVVFSALYL